MALPHKDIVFPEVDLSGDEGDPDWSGEDMVPEGSHFRWVRPPGLHARVWGYKQEEWKETATAYEAEPDSFYRSWHYLDGHPVYWRFYPREGLPANNAVGLQAEYGFGSDAISVFVTRVCNECGMRHKEPERNTKTEIRLETGKWELFLRGDMKQHVHFHDTELDCGGDTYEEAVIKLARLVWERYGNDRCIADAL